MQVCKKLITAAVSGGIVSDCPGGISAAADHARNKTAVLILANDFDLLLLTRDVVEII
jgi:hypothetical protein